MSQKPVENFSVLSFQRYNLSIRSNGLQFVFYLHCSFYIFFYLHGYFHFTCFNITMILYVFDMADHYYKNLVSV